MPITGLDRMPGSGLARGTLFDKEINITALAVPTIDISTSIILEKSGENRYTITWTQPSGADRILSIPALSTADTFTFNAATQTLTNKNITVTALDAAAADLTIFNTVGANTLTIGAGGTTVNIAGNLTVSGTTTTVNSNTVAIADALILLNRDETGTPSHDSGYIIERGSSTNVGFIWDESADEWSTINTSSTGTEEGDVTIASYANFQAAGISAASIALGGKLTAGSNEIEGSAFDIDGGDISAVTISGGLTWSSAQNLNSQALTNVNIDSGDISAATISGDLTWSSNQDMGTINLQTGGKLIMDIDSGATINSSGGGVDGAGSITLGAGQDAGLYVSSDNLYIENKTSDKDIIFRGNDGGTFTTLMTIDTSDATVILPAATITTVDINGGAIDAVTIGTNSAVTELQVDNININGNTIISTDSNGDITLTPNGTGEVNIAAGNLNYAGTAITTTGAELNVMGGGTSATGTTLATADRVVVNDDGTMKQVAMSDFETFMESNLDTLNSVTSASALATVGALDSGSITSGFTSIDVGSGAITTTGTITGGSVTVDDINLNDKIITLTGSSGDTATMSAATNGAFSLITVDAAGTDAAIQITADGTVDIDSAVGDAITLDSGAAINLEPAVGSVILLDGTISVDGGVVTGATSITSSAYNVGNDTLAEYIADTIGAMVTNNTETNITVTYEDSNNTLDFVIGTLNQDTTGNANTATTATTATNATHVTVVDNENESENNLIPFIEDAAATGNVGLESDGDLHYNPSTGTLTATTFVGTLSGSVTTATNITGAANDENESQYLAFLDNADTNAQQVLYDTNLTYNPNTNTLTASNISAFTLGGKLTAGANEIEGSAFDINGGTVDAITSLTVANNVDVGNYKVTAKAFEASDLTAGRITFAGANGLLADDSDLTFSTDTLTATKIGAFEAAGAINFASQNMTLVDIDSGTIDGTDITIGSGKTLNVSAGTLTLADGQIAGAKIADDAIDSDHYAAASVDFAHIQNVAANSILGRNANDSGVLSEVTLATTQILIGDGTGFTAAALSGDATMTNAGVVSLAAAQTNVNSLLAASIVIGEDSQTKIDFETANEIHFDADNTERVKIDSTGLTIVSGSLETATIDYTDGDLAITIADGGGITAAAGITSTAAANTLGATSFNDANITNVGSIALDTITSDGSNVGFGTDGSGEDVYFYSATGGDHMFWDASDEKLVITGTNGQNALEVPDGNVTITDNLTVSGDLTVAGSQTQINTTNLTVTDPLIKLAQGTTASPANDLGIIFTRGNGSSTNIANRAILWDESADIFVFANTNDEAGTTTGNVDIDDYASIRVGAITADDNSTFTGTISTATGSTIGNLTLANGSITDSSGAIAFGNENLSTTGVITAGGFTIGNAVIIESELEMIDGITAGTAAASKAVVLDASKNIATIGTIGSGAITSSGVVTATGFTIGSAAITETELEILDGASVTTAELNLIDGGTARGTTAIADGDGVLINDDGTMRMTTVQTLAAYLDDEITAMPNLVTTGTIGTGVWEGTDVAVAHGGTGASSLTDGGVLLGSGTGAITAMAVLADGEMIVGDGTTDPEAESGATLRTSIGVGTGDSPQFTGIELGHASDTTIARSGSGAITVEGTQVLLAGAQTGVTTILNASTKIGRDADNLVDFATTDNNIIFRANGENQLTLSDGALTPSSNAIVDLGTDALEFKDAYFDGTLEADAYTVNGTTLAEYISDTTGAMFSSNTETGLSATYQDGDNTIDLAIAADQTTIESIYATDLIMGEDSQTAIDFGTANEIDFKVDNANRLTIDSTRMYHYGTSGTDVGDNPDSQVRFYDQSGVAQNNGAGLTLGGQPNSGENWNYVALKAYKANGTADNVEAGLKIYTIDNSTRQLEQRMQINGEGQVAIGDAFDSPDTLLDIRSLDNTTAYHDIITFGVGTTAAGSANHPARFGIGSGFTDNDRTYWSLNWKDNGDHDAGGAGAKDEAGWTAVQIALKNSVDDNEADTGILFRAVEDDDTGDLATKMVMLPNGNFGIGDTSPTYKLDVNGTGRFTGTATFDGNIDVDGTVGIDSSPADETVSGITASFTAGEALVRGEVVYFKASDSKMWKAVATAAATSRCIAMAAEDISADASGKFLLYGFLQDNGSFPAYTVGGTLYTPEAEQSSQNVPEQTAPDSDGHFVQVIGWAVTANSVFFNPSNDVIEHA